MRNKPKSAWKSAAWDAALIALPVLLSALIGWNQNRQFLALTLSTLTLVIWVLPPSRWKRIAVPLFAAFLCFYSPQIQSFGDYSPTGTTFGSFELKPGEWREYRFPIEARCPDARLEVHVQGKRMETVEVVRQDAAVSTETSLVPHRDGQLLIARWNDPPLPRELRLRLQLSQGRKRLTEAEKPTEIRIGPEIHQGKLYADAVYAVILGRRCRQVIHPATLCSAMPCPEAYPTFSGKTYPTQP